MLSMGGRTPSSLQPVRAGGRMGDASRPGVSHVFHTWGYLPLVSYSVVGHRTRTRYTRTVLTTSYS